MINGIGFIGMFTGTIATFFINMKRTSPQCYEEKARGRKSMRIKCDRIIGGKHVSKKLFSIKLAHTIVWLFYVFIISYVLYSGIYNKLDIYTWIAIGLVIVEGIILIVFKGKCPITILGYKYTNNLETGFDIFLPKWLAKNNKAIFGTIFITAVLIIIYRVTKM